MKTSFLAAAVSASLVLLGCGGIEPEELRADAPAQAARGIVGGNAAAPGQFPWQARLIVDGGHYCGGSLIHPSWVLTSGNCVEGLAPSQLSVVLGDHLFDQTEATEQVQTVSRVIMHPSYRHVNIAPVDDVALIELTSPVTLNAAVQPIALQQGAASASAHTLSGWGTTQFGNTTGSNELRFASLPVTDNASCDGAPLVRNLFASELCAGYLNGSVGACNGDGGGALVTQGSGVVEQVGVASWGNACGTYAVFARVSSFVPWINKILAGGAPRAALYRSYNPNTGDHLYTTDWNELGMGGPASGYYFENITGYVYTTQLPGSTPLYRYFNSGNSDHFYTTDWNELGFGRYGWAFEQVAAYVPTASATDTTSLYGYYNTSNRHHFYTTDWNELGGGSGRWVFEAVRALVFTTP